VRTICAKADEKPTYTRIPDVDGLEPAVRPTDPHEATAGLAHASVDDLRSELEAGRTTSEAIVDALISRIAAIDSPASDIALQAVLAVAPDAMARARELDAERSAGQIRSALHGVPVLIKDNIEALGLPGTAGSLALAGRTVVQDSPLVQRLREAGTLVLGATNMSEWANFRSPMSTSGWSGVGGLTGNPWALDRSAGGSSSGSGAAVAAGLAPLAVGTETNGSITCPAALNGVVGIKASVGSIPSRGIVPISLTQDAPGPFGRSVHDAAMLLEILTATPGLTASCAPEAARALRIGVAGGWLTGDAATDAVFETALSVLAPVVATVQSVYAPAADFAIGDDQRAALIAEFADDLGAYLAERPGDGVHSVADVVAFNNAHADEELQYFGQSSLEKVVASAGRASDAYREARARNVAWARDVCLEPALGEGVDLLIAPAYRPSWKSDFVHGDVLAGGGAVCTPAAILGWPILTVPMGLVEGLPVALSVVGRPGSEASLIAVGHAFEQALGLAASGGLRPAWRQPQRG